MAKFSSDLTDLIRPPTERRASDAVADIVLKMLGN